MRQGNDGYVCLYGSGNEGLNRVGRHPLVGKRDGRSNRPVSRQNGQIASFTLSWRT